MFLYEVNFMGYEGIELYAILSHEKEYSKEEYQELFKKAIRKITKSRTKDIGVYGSKIIESLIKDFGFQYASIKQSIGVMYDDNIKEVLVQWKK